MKTYLITYPFGTYIAQFNENNYTAHQIKTTLGKYIVQHQKEGEFYNSQTLKRKPDQIIRYISKEDIQNAKATVGN